ncbi:MAG: fimbrillin family protein [Bacteroidales bacterium]|nr:fimbrillin family protein [Bacteroidales bacterium]
MKRLFFYLFAVSAILLASVSCVNSVIEQDEVPVEIGFKAVTNIATKADPELVGASLGTDNDYVIYAAASADGSPRYFDPDAASYGGQLFAYFTDGGKWFPASGNGPYTKQHIYWPFGGVKVDFLAYALTPAAKEALAPTFHSDTHAREFTIADWDTFANQYDVMYAVANGCVPGTDGNVALAFKHAQALIAFTAKKSATTTVDLTINKITIKDLEYKGTLTVDNYRANLKASWTISAHGDKDLSSAEGIADFPYTLNSTATQLTTNLLVPEQSAKQIVINYSMGGKTFDYELNIPRTPWEMGKKYTFNLEFSAAEITFTTSLDDWSETVDNEQIG